MVEAGKDDFAARRERGQDLREVREELGGAGTNNWREKKRWCSATILLACLFAREQ